MPSLGDAHLHVLTALRLCIRVLDDQNLKARLQESFSIGGSVTGLVGGGLVLQNNDAGDLPIAADGSFTFSARVASGAAYNVTVLSQPTAPAQRCVVANGSGTIASANVTSISVTCATDQFTVGGEVSGLTGTGLVLQKQWR